MTPNINPEMASTFTDLSTDQQLDHSQQITVLRDLVASMGVYPSSSPHDESTGL
jgi:hypothetical protein